MVPNIHLELGRVRAASVLQWVAPFFPGGSAVIGALAASNSVVSNFMKAGSIGYYSKVASLVFMAYGIGLATTRLCAMFSGGIAGGVAYLDKRDFEPWNQVPWRRVAKSFLGAELADCKLQTRTQDAVGAEMEWVKTLPEGSNKDSRLGELSCERLEIAETNLHWVASYGILNFYFNTDLMDSAAQEMWAALQAASWIWICFLAAYPQMRHWSLWILLFSTLIVGVFAPALLAYARHTDDRFGNWQAAKMLAELRGKREF